MKIPRKVKNVKLKCSIYYNIDLRIRIIYNNIILLLVKLLGNNKKYIYFTKYIQYTVRRIYNNS